MLFMEDTLIQLENVSMRFGTTLAVDQVSFTIDQPGTVGLLGPNGAGKSTTMRLITTYLSPTEGKVTVNGKDCAEDPNAVRDQIGYLPEVAPLYPEMQVDEYLNFVGNARGVEDLEKRKAWVVDACGLGPVYRRPIIELSKGFRQRTGLAQALLHDPGILVLDEPTSGLDPLQVIAMRELIAELAKEKIILLSSHILSEVSATSQRLLIINNGQLVADGSLKELQHKAALAGNLVLEAAAPADELKQAVGEIRGVTEVKVVAEEDGLSRLELRRDGEIWRDLNTLLAAKGWPIRQLRPAELSLEQIFLTMTDKEKAA